mmetsp:Transcript_29278/g.83855  ORF Transcript_29278/g.83855 Transcript_29278/m.83855 type:complete len:258 (+) Transcript_29278:664-1437(+)
MEQQRRGRQPCERGAPACADDAIGACAQRRSSALAALGRSAAGTSAHDAGGAPELPLGSCRPLRLAAGGAVAADGACLDARWRSLRPGGGGRAGLHEDCRGAGARADGVRLLRARGYLRGGLCRRHHAWAVPRWPSAARPGAGGHGAGGAVGGGHRGRGRRAVAAGDLGRPGRLRGHRPRGGQRGVRGRHRGCCRRGWSGKPCPGRCGQLCQRRPGSFSAAALAPAVRSPGFHSGRPGCLPPGLSARLLPSEAAHST